MSEKMKSICLIIRHDQYEHLQDMNINVSGFIRDIIDDRLSNNTVVLNVSVDTRLLYDKIVGILSDTFTPSLTALRISVSKKLVLLLEISSYQTALLEQYSLVCATFEELTANVSALSTEKDEADYVVFDQALHSALVSALYTSFDLELQFASQQEFMEQAEVDAVALEDLVAELSEEIQDLIKSA